MKPLFRNLAPEPITEPQFNDDTYLSDFARQLTELRECIQESNDEAESR